MTQRITTQSLNGQIDDMVMLVVELRRLDSNGHANTRLVSRWPSMKPGHRAQARQHPKVRVCVEETDCVVELGGTWNIHRVGVIATRGSLEKPWAGFPCGICGRFFQ